MSSAAPPPPPQASRRQRVLACHAECIPATLAIRRRRRKFPERELLERLGQYEDLLRRNNIDFEAMPKDSSTEEGPLIPQGGCGSDDGHPEAAGAGSPSPWTTAKSDIRYETKSIWRSLNQGFQDVEDDSDVSSDDVSQVLIAKTWDELFENNDHLLFGIRKAAVKLSTLHPEPAHIFRLWQIYLDNVNPLLKVTHVPSLQGRLVEAVSNLANITPTLEALMFSIYCTAILSLVAGDVQVMFGSSQEELLSRCQFGCQQALLNCGFLRCGDRDCLTALYLYLVSVRTNTVPRSLSSMLGIAIRIAERMGINNESDLAKCTALEAEMRRRLWWSLMLFDTRIGELADYKSTKLAPTWDCRIPLNVNDSDLRPEMKEAPESLGTPTDALFAAVQGELGDFVRNTMFYLDLTAPALKPIARNVQNGPVPEGGELIALEKIIEDKYLKSCDPENPLHFMTIWTARAFLAKYRLTEYHSICSSSSVHQTEAQRDTAFSLALTRLKCDTKLMTSSLSRGFIWLVNFHFPFPAYIQIVQDLRRRPVSEQAEQAWATMNENYEARLGSLRKDENPFIKIFAKIVLQAWEAREAAIGQLGESLTPPPFVSSIRHIMATTAPSVGNDNDVTGMGVDDFLMPMPMDFGNHTYNCEGHAGYTEMGSGVYPHILGRALLDVDLNQLDWSAMHLRPINEPAGPAGSYEYMSGQAPLGTDVIGLDYLNGLGFGQWPT
ncbi:hypothetical protein BP6252_11078 [Coleophoma cylindrospora]|uniref:Xylanolytic transcriptional activator regulatory domain-containing protein n=1 Tax=Coleophoma cylindrospora TaxID=1849047 RepID=A0A3D8QNY6_9HELO|nr:hypothetical protein BP6252_11078 [Coleophoma cylindrospora]